MGNLRDFLHSSHGSVVYANMAGNSLTLTCRDLLSFAWQSARGMSYLASQKVSCLTKNLILDSEFFAPLRLRYTSMETCIA